MVGIDHEGEVDGFSGETGVGDGAEVGFDVAETAFCFEVADEVQHARVDVDGVDVSVRDGGCDAEGEVTGARAEIGDDVTFFEVHVLDDFFGEFVAFAVWTFQLYAFVVLYALVFYLACAILFPERMHGYDGYRDFFYSRRRWFFGLLAFSLVIDVGDSWFKGSEHFASLGPEYTIATGVKFVLFIAAAATRNAFFHGLFAVTFLGYQVYWALRMFETVA